MDISTAPQWIAADVQEEHRHIAAIKSSQAGWDKIIAQEAAVFDSLICVLRLHAEHCQLYKMPTVKASVNDITRWQELERGHRVLVSAGAPNLKVVYTDVLNTAKSGRVRCVTIAGKTFGFDMAASDREIKFVSDDGEPLGLEGVAAAIMKPMVDSVRQS